MTSFCPSCSQGTQLFAQRSTAPSHAPGVLLIEVVDDHDLGEPGPSLSSFASPNGDSEQPEWILAAGYASGTTTCNPRGLFDVYYVLSAQGITVSSGQGLAGVFFAALHAAVSSSTTPD